MFLRGQGTLQGKYENILLAWDLIIGILDKNKDSKNYLSDLCDTSLLSNLISEVTCVKSLVGSSIDVMLTNRPRSFHYISLIETGLSDYHKLILFLEPSSNKYLQKL